MYNDRNPKIFLGRCLRPRLPNVFKGQIFNGNDEKTQVFCILGVIRGRKWWRTPGNPISMISQITETIAIRRMLASALLWRATGVGPSSWTRAPTIVVIVVIIMVATAATTSPIISVVVVVVVVVVVGRSLGWTIIAAAAATFVGKGGELRTKIHLYNLGIKLESSRDDDAGFCNVKDTVASLG
jgi:hypothetical protein